MSMQLDAANLTDPKEGSYFVVVLIFSILIWLACLLTIIPMIYIALIVLMIWLGNGLLVAELRAEAVKVEQSQLPALAETFARVCAKLNIAQVPELYVIQSGGLLNAFATRFCGRDFVVVYSDLLETYGPDSAEMEFLLGHEIGHIKRKHILKHVLLAPGLLMPLIGNAYNRACEATCDRHGMFAASNPDGAINAMLALAGGRQAKALMTPASFAAQHTAHRGFFVSWHELISGYPTLSQRVANLIAIRDGVPFQQGRRNGFAYLFAFFSIGSRASGGANLLITIFIIAMLAAVSLPAITAARSRAQQIGCLNNMKMIERAKMQVALDEQLKDGDEVTEAQMESTLGTTMLKLNCPAEGEYLFNAIGDEPECTEHGSLSDAALSPMPRRQLEL